LPNPADSFLRLRPGLSSLSHQKNQRMFEQTFKNIDDILHKDASCTSELPWARIGESGIITVV
jgi:hypothetical protein